MQQNSLLETLIQCDPHAILSNLRTPEGQQAAARAAKHLQPQDFALTQWNEALSYLTGKPCCFSDVQQALAYLLSLETETT